MLCDECRKVEAIQGDDYCTKCKTAIKECKGCHAELSIFDFAANQRTPRGAMNRRSYCKSCYKKRKGKYPKRSDIDEFESTSPRPPIGDTFQCPLCERIFTVTNNKLVNLDHDHITGEIRGWICQDCNTSMGRMGDDISTLARAIIWLKTAGKGL